MISTKICTMCGVEKPTTEFNKRTRSKDGLFAWCKPCYKKWAAEYYLKNKERIQEQHRKYHLQHRERDLERQRRYAKSPEGEKKKKEYYATHKEQYAQNRKEYYQRNRELLLEKNRIYQKANKDKVHKWHKTYSERHAEQIAQQQKRWRENNREEINKRRLKRLQEDPLCKRAGQLRCNIRDAFRCENHMKKSKTAEIVGCDLYTFKEYLLGTWEKRYGKKWQGEPYQFHHIVPLSTAKTEEELLNLSHYTNIELISPDDHMKEHGKTKRLVN